jgi:Flp pilus assembly protein TadG
MRAWMRRSSIMVRRLAGDERGVELIEFLGFVPLVLLVFFIVWQFILITYTGLVTAGTAREGARAAVTLEAIDPAVAWGSPGFDGRREWSASASCQAYAGGPTTVEVALETPRVTFPFLGALSRYPQVQSEATMRCEPPFDAR